MGETIALFFGVAVTRSIGGIDGVFRLCTVLPSSP